MIYILAIGIICIGIVSFLCNRKHLLNPACVACAVFLVSTLFAIYSKNDWQYVLHPITVFVILSSLFVFFIGSKVGTDIADKNIASQERTLFIKPPSVTKVIAITLILLYFAYLHYLTILEIGRAMNADLNSFGDILKKARTGMLYHNYVITRIDTYSTYFARAFAYIGIFLFCYSKLIFGKTIKYIYLLLPCIPHLFKCILSTGRTQFIYLAVYCIVIYGVLYFQKKGINTKSILKIMLFGVISLCLFFAFFGILQLMREKNTKSVFDTISFYAGMSIPSLDDYLVNGRPESTLIGNNTLFPIYDILRKIGFNLPKLYAPYDFISFNGTSGNVYTALRRYIEDYSLIGNYIILIIEGTIASFSYNFCYKRQNSFFSLILLGSFIYPVFELSIEERVFMNLIGTATIYNIIALVVSYYLLCKKKNIKAHTIC